MIVGFTGTRNGMTEAQRAAVRAELSKWRTAAGDLMAIAGDPDGLSGLHGDCVGADADFDALCREHQIPTSCRPCTFESMRAMTGAREIAEPVRPMERNRAIVADADIMIACPPNDTPIKKGSGTWATIRFAERADVPTIIVFPDGRRGGSYVEEMERSGRLLEWAVRTKQRMLTR